MDKMVRFIRCAKTPSGKLVEVDDGPLEGFAIGDTVYQTSIEANAEAGRINQQCYIDEQISEIDYGISFLIDAASPFAEWREKYGERERHRDLVEEFVNGLFPKYGWKRSEYAQRFANAFMKANAVYEEMQANKA